MLLRIGIAVNTGQVTVGSSTPARILNSQGEPIAEIAGMSPLSASRSGNGVQLGSVSDQRLYVQPGSPDGLVFIEKKWYRGLVELIPGSSGVSAINQVGLEDYVSSVIGAEMGHRFPAEALKTQAVASRTYALFHRNQRLDEPFDLGDSVDWQVYKGVASESNLTQEAARNTAGQVMTFQGALINAVFHSSSGGHTEDVANVWSEPLPYLRGVPDYDADAPVFNWSATLTPAQLQGAVGGIGTIRSVEVVNRSPWGRALTVRVNGSGGSKDISATRFRTLLGLRSTMFSISSQGGTTTTASVVPVVAAPYSFLVTGRGFGHGVGMSQWGAAGLADQGWSYQEILGHYYQGTTLANVDGQ